jgi:hypothetical protein
VWKREARIGTWIIWFDVTERKQAIVRISGRTPPKPPCGQQPMPAASAEPICQGSREPRRPVATAPHKISLY